MKKLWGNWRNTAEPSRFYRELVQAAFRPLIPSGLRVLECGTRSGALLASVEPAFGAGVCYDPKTLKQARKSHPEFELYLTEDEISETTFDYIVANDLVNHLPDVQLFLSQLHRFTHARTRIIFNLFNNAWRPFLWVAAKIGIRNRSRIQNWISPEDMRNLLYLAGWEVIKQENRILWEEIQRVAAQYPERNVKSIKQTSHGKGGAVREGFAAARGDVLFILDADLTVPPEELPKFYATLCTGKAEFVNGVRTVYPIEQTAMRFANRMANKFFGLPKRIRGLFLAQGAFQARGIEILPGRYPF